MLCPYCLIEASEIEQVEEDGVVGYRCPNQTCGRILPLAYAQDYANYPAAVFSLIGLSGHGKTCFLSSFLQELDSVGSRWKTFSYTPLDDSSMKDIQDKLFALREGSMPDPTNVAFQEPAILRLDGIPRIGNLQLFLYDNGGEVFTDVMRLREFAPYLTRSRVVVWLVSLKDLHHPTELLQLLMVYREGMLTLKVDSKQQSLVVVLTKADELNELKDGIAVPESIRAILSEEQRPSSGYGWKQIEGLSQDIERWLEEEAEQANFVRRAQSTFAHVRFCIASALGTSPIGRLPGSRINPRGVLVPLYWLARLQLPAVRVDRGTGDRVHLSLQEAVDSAPDDATIQLDTGIYHLAEPLTIRRSITLVGAGSHRTIVACSAIRNVLVAEGDFTLRLEKIHFEHQGAHWANVATVAVSDLSVSDCEFSGAVSSISDDTGKNWLGGNGLRIGGQTRGLILRSRMSGNGLAGVFFLDESEVMIQSSECSDNERYGLAYQGRAKGEVKRTLVKGNGKAGFLIGQTASPTLEENNAEANGLGGIIVMQEAAPILTRNRCLANVHGIIYRDRASGSASGNTLSRNTSDGLLVNGESRPTLEANRAEANKGVGIAFRGRSGGSAVSNECLSNMKDGILVTDETSPMLITNRSEGNTGSGIAYCGQATGVADGNACLKNAKHGILVEDEAGPIVSNNRCHGNFGAGLAFLGRSRGSARHNTCGNNRGQAIDRSEEATPEFDGNRDEQNQTIPTPNTLPSTKKGETTPPTRPRWSLFPSRKA